MTSETEFMSGLLRRGRGLTRDALASFSRRVKFGLHTSKRRAARSIGHGGVRRLDDLGWQQMVDALPAPVYVVDTEGRLLHYNRAAVECWGRAPEGGDRWCAGSKLYHPDGTEMPHDQCPMAAAVIHGRAVPTAEVLVERPDSQRMWVEANPKPLHDSEGRVIGGINVLADMTERKRSEQLDHEQQKLLRMVASGAPLDDCLSTLCAAIPRLNEGARASILFADEQRERFCKSIAPDIDPSFGAGVIGLKDAPISDLAIGTCGEALFRGSAVTSADIANDSRWSQSWRDLCVACGIRAGYSEPVRDTQDRCVASFMLCFDEPRSPGEWEGRLAEFGAQIASIALERERSTEELRESKDRLATELADMERLHALSTRLVQQGRLEGVLHEVLAASTDLLGVDKGSVQIWDGKSDRLNLVSHLGFDENFVARFQEVDADDISTCAAALRTGGRVIVDDLANDPEFTALARVVAPYGARAAMSTPFLGRDGRIIGMFTTYCDQPYRPSERELRLLDLYAQQAVPCIERKQTEEALRESEARLWELNRSLEQRVGERTEELRRQTDRLQQLSAELTTAEYRERKRLAAMLHDDLQQVLVAAQMRLGEARSREEQDAAAESIASAEQLLSEAMSKSRNLTRELRPPILYEGGLAAALKGLASDLEQRYGLRVDVNASDSVPALHDDLKALLFDCSRELLFNTAKHAGVEHASVELHCEEGRLRLSVRDGGRGFDPDTMEESDRHTEGFGFFSIRERLTALGGYVEIESALGEGVRVEMEVPVTVASDTAEGVKGDAQTPASDQIRGDQRTRIVVVDDHAMVRQGIARVIGEHDWFVVVGEAGDGMEAIEIVEQQRPDVVLMDVQMPRMNGIEAAREISYRWPQTLTVGLSVQNDEPTAQSMRQAGAVGFLPKSGNTDQMVSTILGLIELPLEASENRA